MKNLMLHKFYSDICSILDVTKSSITKAVNFAMEKAYWEIGKKIVEEEQKGKGRIQYGENFIKELKCSCAESSVFKRGKISKVR